MAKYNKLVAAFLAAFTGVGVTVLVPGINEAWGTVLTAVLATLATYFAPANEQDAPGLASDDK